MKILFLLLILNPPPSASTLYLKQDDQVLLKITTTMIKYYNQEKMVFGGYTFNVTHPISKYDPNSAVFKNNTILVSYMYGPDHLSRTILALGGNGMIMGSDWGWSIGRAGYYLEQPRKHIEFPSVQVSDVDYKKILSTISSNGRPFLVTIDSEELILNEWDTFCETQASFLKIAFMIGTAVMVAVVLYLFIKTVRQKFQFTMKFLVISLELFNVILRFIFAVLDPWQCERNIPWIANNLMMYSMAPFAFSITLLVALLWFESVIDSIKVISHKFLKGAQVPFQVGLVVLILSVLSIAIPALIAPFIIQTYIVILMTIILSIWLIVSISHFLIGILIIKEIRASDITKKVVTDLTIKIIFMTILEIISILSLIFVPMPLGLNPYLSNFLTLMYVLSLEVRTLVHLSIYNYSKDTKSEGMTLKD